MYQINQFYELKEIETLWNYCIMSLLYNTTGSADVNFKIVTRCI